MVSNNHTTEAVYAFIKRYVEEWGLPPSQREIAEGCFITNSRSQTSRSPGSVGMD